MVDQSYKNLVAKRNRLDKTWSKKSAEGARLRFEVARSKTQVEIGK